MNVLVTLENISLSYGLNPLLDHVKLSINDNERICLIGRNGAGKSSLLRLIEGSILPDEGKVFKKNQITVSRLSQELPTEKDLTIFAYVSLGLKNIGELLNEYHNLTILLQNENTTKNLDKLHHLQTKIDALNGWKYEQRIHKTIERLLLKPDMKLTELSGGWQRKCALAQAIVAEPDLLLLDEPTNHLDITSIEWLENEILNNTKSVLFITHDRSLLKKLATRIIELDRGNLTSWPGDYNAYLKHKTELLLAENKEHAAFDKKLAEEEKWIRQGIKARRTRNEGRVRALLAMRKERAKRIQIEGRPSFSLNEAERSGQLVIDAQNISFTFEDQAIVKDFNLRVIRGDRVALVGPNGIGKSTLINLLLKKISPRKGNVTHGTNVKIAYFDQLREKLDPQKSVIDNVAEGRQMIDVHGKSVHIISYLSNFLFSKERAFTPVGALSGGERNRLLLARLFTQSANLLVMDEPTNDLDIETLELLEELLMDFKGTLILVSHDRAFIDNIVTSMLYFEGNGKITEFVGGYSDFLTEKVQRPKEIIDISITKEKDSSFKTKSESVEANKKLTYNEQRELSNLPKKIEKLEANLLHLQTIINSPDYYKNTHHDTITKQSNEFFNLQKEIESLYVRWNELESKS